MGSRDGLLLWVLGGAGILFLYAAWSKQHPAAVLGKTLGTATGAGTAGAGASDVAAPAGIHNQPSLAPALAPFRSRLGPDVPAPYTETPNLYIPGTWNA